MRSYKDLWIYIDVPTFSKISRCFVGEPFQPGDHSPSISLEYYSSKMEAEGTFFSAENFVFMMQLSVSIHNERVYCWVH